MLCLGLKIGESFMINDNIEVMYLGCRHGVVRVGIRAPREVPVHRKTVYQRIQAEKELVK